MSFQIVVFKPTENKSFQVRPQQKDRGVEAKPSSKDTMAGPDEGETDCLHSVTDDGDNHIDELVDSESEDPDWEPALDDLTDDDEDDDYDDTEYEEDIGYKITNHFYR